MEARTNAKPETPDAMPEAMPDWATLEAADQVRLSWEPDEDAQWGDIAGDVFNPEANPTLDPAQLRLDELEYMAYVRREGVWGVIGEYRDPCGNWQHGASLWCVVRGPDDGPNSYPVPDIQQETLEARAEVTPAPPTFELHAMLPGGAPLRIASGPDLLALMDAADEHESTGGLFSEPRHRRLEQLDVDGQLYMTESSLTGNLYIIRAVKGGNK